MEDRMKDEARELREGMEDMVMVPVPKRLVMDVYRFLGNRASSGDVVRQDDGTEGNIVREPTASGWPEIYDWPEDQLRDVLDNGTRAVRVILRYLAEHYPKMVSGQELAEAVYGEDATTRQLGGALGSFTKTMGRLYGKVKWPFRPVQNEETGGVLYYQMNARNAETIRRILGL